MPVGSRGSLSQSSSPPPAPKVGSTARIFALLDLHVNYAENMNWVLTLCRERYQSDIVIEAGKTLETILGNSFVRLRSSASTWREQCLFQIIADSGSAARIPEFLAEIAPHSSALQKPHGYQEERSVGRLEGKNAALLRDA